MQLQNDINVQCCSVSLVNLIWTSFLTVVTHYLIINFEQAFLTTTFVKSEFMQELFQIDLNW